jgi:hypothetical protein
MPQPIIYSVAAANKRLPYVRTIVRDIVALAQDIQQRQERLEEIQQLHEQSSGASPHADELQQMFQAVDQDFLRFEDLEKELSGVDVKVVDRSSGLVEIRSLLDDQPVFLSWQPDEPEFMFWRSSSDDLMMRRPLMESVGGGSNSFAEETDTKQ